jgi:SAM-dependent methyltransferase
MNWQQLDWAALDRLRDGFLNGGAADGPYWRSASDLASYDATYAERIGWKWDAVLRELAARRWRPPATTRTILDWGCGSGVAGRRVIEALGPDAFDALYLWDHSSLARDFAAARARDTFPSLAVSEFADSSQRIGLLVVSHVLNELPADALNTLLGLVARADAVLWVEPGTHAVSRQLIGVREQVRNAFDLIAPCPHQGMCGLLAAGNERHWCHFFAPPPAGVQNDSDWVRFGQRAGIDLRSLPYSYLVLEKKPARLIPPEGAARILGRAEHFKGFARVLSCEAPGVVEERELQKRADAELFKQLKKDTSHPLYRWECSDGRITGATRV